MIQVTFTLPKSLWADVICLVGDFNNWHHSSHPLGQDHQGNWMITIPLQPNKTYQFRYLIDGHTWTNDDNADAYIRNFSGSDNSVVVTDPEFEKHLGD